MNRRRAPVRPWFTVLAWLLCGSPALAGDALCWRELGFTASNGWVGASSVLRFERVPSLQELAARGAPPAERLQPSGPWIGKIHVEFQAMSNTGELQTWYDPETQAALQSRRLSRGKESRLKIHRFLRSAVWRERREPGADPDAGDAGAWKARSAALIPYGADVPAGTVVMTPVMLLQRAAQMVSSRRTEPLEQLVFTDTQLYRVRLVASAQEQIDVDFRLVRGDRETRVQDTRNARRVSLMPRLVGAGEEDEEFSLLELTGELAIIIDSTSGLPLRVQGSWLHMGTIPADLSHAKVDPDCGAQ